MLFSMIIFSLHFAHNSIKNHVVCVKVVNFWGQTSKTWKYCLFEKIGIASIEGLKYVNNLYFSKFNSQLLFTSQLNSSIKNLLFQF